MTPRVAAGNAPWMWASASRWQVACSSSGLRAQSTAHSATSSPKPTSFAPTVTTTIRTWSRRATAASWSACGGSSKCAVPPSSPGQRSRAFAPEQARFTFSSTSIGALSIGATSERWQSFASLAP